MFYYFMFKPHLDFVVLTLPGPGYLMAVMVRGGHVPPPPPSNLERF